MTTNYYNPKIHKTVTHVVLSGMLGGVPPKDILRLVGWYPIRYEYLQYNPDTHKMLPVDELAFDDASQEYVQNFALVELTAGEKEQRQQAKQHEADEKRHEEILLELKDIDSRSERCVRAVSKALAHGQTPNPDDLEKVDGYEAQAEELREELRTLG